MNQRIGAIIQARLGSSRLPSKVLKDICGKPLIWHIIDRLTKSNLIDSIVLATSKSKLDDSLELWALENGINCFRGDENDVLGRFYNCAQLHKFNTIVRITADDPFKDPKIIDQVISHYSNEKLDFASNNNPPSFPEGFDVEVFSMNALKLANKNAIDSFDREHVTQYFYKNPDKIKSGNISYKKDISNLRCTIDTEKDLEMARLVYSYLYNEDKIFLLSEILELFKSHPEIPNININEQKSTMYIKSK